MGIAAVLTMLLTGIGFALIAIGIGKGFGMHSWNPQKGEPYECGIPTEGVTWVQFNVGYYLFSLIYLVFDVEIVFLFPWATVVKEMGMFAFVEILFFSLFLFLGLLYAFKKKALSWM